MRSEFSENHAAKSWMDPDRSRNVVCVNYIVSLAENKRIFSSDQFWPPPHLLKVGETEIWDQNAKLENRCWFRAISPLDHNLGSNVLVAADNTHFSLQNEPQSIKIGYGTTEYHTIKVDHSKSNWMSKEAEQNSNLAQFQSTLIAAIFAVRWS